jgi:hypothetical protein
MFKSILQMGEFVVAEGHDFPAGDVPSADGQSRWSVEHVADPEVEGATLVRITIS